MKHTKALLGYTGKEDRISKTFWTLEYFKAVFHTLLEVFSSSGLSSRASKVIKSAVKCQLLQVTLCYFLTFWTDPNFYHKYCNMELFDDFK